MVMRIEFKNFRCLRDTSLDLTPLTVIVGPNASGKSSILAALEPKYRPVQSDMWQRRGRQNVVIRRIDDRRQRNVSVLHGSTEPDETGFTYTYQYLRLDTSALRAPNTVEPQHQLMPGGANLTNLFDTLDRETQSMLVKEFCGLVPVFSDVNAIPFGNGSKHLVFTDRWNDSAKYQPAEVSDGSLLVFAFLILRYQMKPPDILAIEELERGLHPYLIGELVSFLRRMTKGEFGGKKTRVVIATHSPGVLEFAEPEEARFLTRADDGSVHIDPLPLKDPNWPKAFENYKRSLGSVWQSGQVGGVPSA